MVRDRIGAEETKAKGANWLEICDELRALHKVAGLLGAEMNADIEAFGQARSLAAQLAADISAASPGPQLVRMVTHARQMLAGWSEQLDQGAGGGLTQLRTGREVARAVGRAVRASKSDRPLSLSVAALHSYALSRYADVHARSYGYGVYGDCSRFVADVDRATAAVESGEHADALVQLEAAIEQIELEDARAAAAAGREQRKWQVKIMAHDAASNEVEEAGGLGNRSSWTSAASTLGAPSDATQ
jgi:hypothetical protein